jgi:hypothetical protein
MGDWRRKAERRAAREAEWKRERAERSDRVNAVSYPAYEHAAEQYVALEDAIGASAAESVAAYVRACLEGQADDARS